MREASLRLRLADPDWTKDVMRRWQEFYEEERRRRRFAAAKGDARRLSRLKERAGIALDWSPYVPWKEDDNA